MDIEKKTKLLSKDIDLIVYDFDGVMTDNQVFVLQNGMEAVRCCRADGLGVDMIKDMGVQQVIISTESNPVVEVRAKKIDLPVIFNCKDKLKDLELYCVQNGFELLDILFVGNDINDFDVMNAVGISACPADAHPSILKIATIVLESKGGCGVVRELAGKLER